MFALVIVGVRARPGGDSSEEDSGESSEEGGDSSPESDESGESAERGFNMSMLEEFFRKHMQIA